MTQKKMFALDFSTIELRILAAMASKELNNMNMLKAMEMNVPPEKFESAKLTLRNITEKVERKLRED
jgi:DNA polymerase I-like protein with 3'-5' exonuclease and polymerase domains